MRGLKAKTFRAVARNSKLPAETLYGVKIHNVAIENPKFGIEEGATQFLSIQRPQLMLAACRRRAVQRMKKMCPKGSFFGMSLRYFRTGGKSDLAGMTITPIDGPPETQ